VDKSSEEAVVAMTAPTNSFYKSGLAENRASEFACCCCSRFWLS